MPRIKISVNDANGVAETNSHRVAHIAELAGAKPSGSWKKSMDSGRGISTAYYAEALECEYEFDGDTHELKTVMKGAQYIRASPDVKTDEFSGLTAGGVRYLKLCDIDLWVPTKILFIPSWEKLRTTVVAKKMKLNEEEFTERGLKKFEELMSKAPPNVKKAVSQAEENLVSIHKSRQAS